MRLLRPTSLAALLPACLLLCAGLVCAVPLRVVPFNIETNRDIEGKVTEVLNAPGSPANFFRVPASLSIP